MTWSRERRGSEAAAGGETASGPTPGKRARTDGLRLKARPGAEAAAGGELATAREGTAGPATGFPHQAAIEASFERPLTASAHTDERAAGAASALGAEAYAVDGRVGFGDACPTLFVAAHEAAHTMQDDAAVRRFGGGADPYEAHADAVASRVVAGESAADLLGGGSAPAVVRRFSGGKESLDHGEVGDGKDASARFENDPHLEGVKGGTEKVGRGGRGLSVTKLQQALIDLGYQLPKYGVDGKFEGETKAAVVKFQTDRGLSPSGELDQATMDALHVAYDTRKPYVDNATFDPAHPGTRTLSADDKTAVDAAMVPAGGAGHTFQETIATHPDPYGTRIKARLTALVAALHKDLYADKVGLRADPAANFHDWSAMEGAAQGAKQVTDAMYGSYATAPPMTHAAGNFLDQWEDEEQRNGKLKPDEKKAKAREKVQYLIDSNCAAINKEHDAVSSKPAEKAILDPIKDEFVDSDAKVQTLLEIDVGWEGAQLEGTVYLQRYKSTDPDKDKAKEANRVQMWELFHTCIHEYLHTLAHADYATWAQTKDPTRYNTLIEGFCDFFTLNVRSTLAPDPALITTVEGPYGNGKPVPTVKSGVYPSHQQAEQVVSIVGIKNAQAAYFQGDVKAMGGP
jgi:peptidoglycan hydrolase-like protein with peptidoglycan-binding domain